MEELTTSAFDRPQAVSPWQLGMTPPAGVRFEMPEAGAGGGEGGGEAAAGAAAVLDPAAGGGEQGGEQGGADAGVEYLTPDDIANLVRENAGSAFQEMLAQADAREQAARQQAAAARERAAANVAPEFDPFDPQSVESYLAWQREQTKREIMEQVAPALEFAQEGSLEAGKSQANSILDGFHKELGDFDHDTTILKAAAYTRQGLDPEQALEQAATEQAAYEARIEARAFEKFKSTGQNLADAGVEPGAGGAAAEVATQPLTRAGQRIDYKDAARATLARSGIGGGVRDPSS